MKSKMRIISAANTLFSLLKVFTCGDNSSYCCGHGEVGRTIFRPTRIEALDGIPCKQVNDIKCCP